MPPRLLFVVAASHYFISHRLSLALAAQKQGMEVAVATTSSKNFSEDKRHIESLGIKVFEVPFHRTGINPFNDIPTFKALYSVFKHFKPDILHNVALKPILYGSFIGKITKIPKIINAIAGLGYVFTSHTLKSRIIRTILLPFLKFSLKKTVIIVQNPDDEATIRTWLGHSADSLHLIQGVGVNTDNFSPAPSLPHNHVITLVARMLWSKGIGEVITAAKRLKIAYPQATIQLVGAPDLQNPDHVPENTLQKWHNEGLIQWLGERTDVAEIYQNSQIALLPSYREGLPKSLLEAMATGLPIITTDAPGCKSLITGTNGLLIPSRNSDALYHAIKMLLDNYSLCQKMGHASRLLALSTFSERIMHEKTLMLYCMHR